MMGKTLLQILSSIQYQLVNVKCLPEHEILSISADSRQVDSSTLFVALHGMVTDGHQFILQALEAGCRAVIVEKDRFSQGKDPLFDDVCIISVTDSREAYGHIAAAFYDYPARKLKMIGITGTNGKTSVTYLLEHVLHSKSYRVGVIGTVSYRFIDEEKNPVEIPAALTTPEPLILQELLCRMVRAGVEYVLMEVSSHALDQKRIASLLFDVCVFTNLSHDHLDYHHNMEDYFGSKVELFGKHLKQGGKAVICRGVQRQRDEWSSRLIELCVSRHIFCLDCGDKDTDFVRLVDETYFLNKTVLNIQVEEKHFNLNSQLVGRFNIENLLTALTIGVALGFNVRSICSGLSEVNGVPGRLQQVNGYTDDGSQPMVFVDYAHTPDALEKVLITLSELPHERIITVFGCGGDRDQGKRSLMGEIAAQYSDIIIVTNDNPRSESPAKIIAQIRTGLEKGGVEIRDEQWLIDGVRPEKGFLIIHQREQAIRVAITNGGHDDIVLIAGKGHETYQLNGRGKRFFDDCLEAGENLCSWTCKHIAAAVDGRLVSYNDEKLESVCIDSRTIKPGDIFVALKGENFNGHDFIHQAVAGGCRCIIVSEPVHEPAAGDVGLIIVKDTLKALGDLAAYRRRILKSVTDHTVIGLTGSCGKTTVKEMVAAILQRRWPDGENVPPGRVLKTKGNFNNLVGLPLSLLPIGLKEKAVILEMGMNMPGEIKRLTAISDPDIGCITNVHPAHLLGLHSIEGVARAKEELFSGCRPDSSLVINLDDPFIRQFSRKYKQNKISYSMSDEGIEQGADVWATDVSLTGSGCGCFTLHIKDQQADVVLKIAGLHNIANGLAAAATAHLAGAAFTDIIDGLQDIEPVDKRMETIVTQKGCSILNDTYNANPASMRAGLLTLGQLGTGRKVAILGDMFELGESSGAAHHQIGCFAAKQGVDQLIVVGEFAEQVGEGAVGCGMKKSRIISFATKEEMMCWLNESEFVKELDKHDWLLVKGSRGMGLEAVVELLVPLINKE